MPIDGVTETCTAGAGTLLIEFGILSRLIKDPIYESYARKTLKSLWELKNKDTGLLGKLHQVTLYCIIRVATATFTLRRYTIFNLINFDSFHLTKTGNTVDIQSGKWTGQISGIGAGMDSYFEYLFKSFVLFNEVEDLETFQSSYETIKTYLRKGYSLCSLNYSDLTLIEVKIL